MSPLKYRRNERSIDRQARPIAPAPQPDRLRAARQLVKQPMRLWMTGSIAVVMAALMPSRVAAESERSETHRVLRHSRYGVGETVQRIEAAALSRGLTVLARMGGTPQPVIVFESSVGGTLVVMDENQASVEIPFSLKVRASDDGGSDVWLATQIDPAQSAWKDVPERVVADLAMLPELVDRAVS